MWLCRALIGFWAVVWLVALPQRGLVAALDFTNPSLLGILAFSAGLFLVGYYGVIPAKIASVSAFAISMIGIGLTVSRELSTRPITFEPGVSLTATFRIPEEFALPVTGVEIGPPVRNPGRDHFRIELSCDDEALGERGSRDPMNAIGWLFGPFGRNPGDPDALTSSDLCTATVRYESAVEFFRPSHDWIWVLSEQGEFANYSVEIVPAQIIRLDY